MAGLKVPKATCPGVSTDAVALMARIGADVLGDGLAGGASVVLEGGDGSSSVGHALQ